LLTKSREDDNEIQGLHAELARNVEIVTVAHAHCEDVSKQLEETRSKARDAAAENARTINSLTADLNAATKEAHGLKQQVAALQQEVAHSTNMNALLDRKSKDEVAKISNLKEFVDSCGK
jgi:chromosome segregation ATPase